jgi:hypothetical protein
LVSTGSAPVPIQAVRPETAITVSVTPPVVDRLNERLPLIEPRPATLSLPASGTTTVTRNVPAAVSTAMLTAKLPLARSGTARVAVAERLPLTPPAVTVRLPSRSTTPR